MKTPPPFHVLVAQASFRFWCEQREQSRREAAGIPGAKCLDLVVRKYRFCNVNREDDAVTRWVKRNVRDRYTAHAPWFQLRQVMVARIFNEPATLREILPVRKIEDTLAKIAEMQADGGKVFRGAYMMPSHPGPDRRMAAPEYYLRAVDRASELFLEDMPTSLEGVAERLLTVRGLGPFLVNQFITDLRYMPYWENAPDWETCVRCGPGTRRGLDRWHGRDPRGTGAQEDYVQELLAVRDELRQLKARFRVKLSIFDDPNNLANSFCEYDKYARALEVLSDGGRPSLRLRAKKVNEYY